MKMKNRKGNEHGGGGGVKRGESVHDGGECENENENENESGDASETHGRDDAERHDHPSLGDEHALPDFPGLLDHDPFHAQLDETLHAGVR